MWTHHLNYGIQIKHRAVHSTESYSTPAKSNMQVRMIFCVVPKLMWNGLRQAVKVAAIGNEPDHFADSLWAGGQADI